MADLLDALAKLYLHWGRPTETERSYEEALAVRERCWRAMADQGDLEGVTRLSWLWATCADPKFRDGNRAASFAERAVAATNRRDASTLDTLAAAYAEAGQFAKAVSVQKEAIVLAHDEHRKEEFESRLILYQSDSPYRQPDVITPVGALPASRGLNKPNPASGHFSKEQLVRSIAPRDTQASTSLIDLSSFYNVPLTESWHEWGSSDLSELPQGIQTFANAQFDVRGLIQVGARYQEGEVYPDRVRAIPVSRPCRRLHFLHAAIYADGTPYGIRIGAYVIHYASGRQTEIPIVVGQSLADWFTQPNEKNQTFTIAWTGLNSESRRQGRTIRLFKSTWDNPLPTETVKTIDFVSFRAGPAPFLVAITAEP